MHNLGDELSLDHRHLGQYLGTIFSPLSDDEHNVHLLFRRDTSKLEQVTAAARAASDQNQKIISSTTAALGRRPKVPPTARRGPRSRVTDLDSNAGD